MKIQYMSDLHLEFPQNSKYIAELNMKPLGDILLLAGDIGIIGDKSYETDPFWDWASSNYEKVYVIPGNYEFYGGFDISELRDGKLADIRCNVELHYNSVVQLDSDTDLVLTTLWSRIDERYAHAIESKMADFWKAKYCGKRFKPKAYNEEHEKCLSFLKDALKDANKRHIVVTHHMPSRKLANPIYKDSIYNSAFDSDQEALMQNCNIPYWIFGHSHYNAPITQIGRTILLTNQLGYLDEVRVESDFDPIFGIDLNRR